MSPLSSLTLEVVIGSSVAAVVDVVADFLRILSVDRRAPAVRGPNDSLLVNVAVVVGGAAVVVVVPSTSFSVANTLPDDCIDDIVVGGTTDTTFGDSAISINGFG
jgi:hypothetical protein